MRGFLVKCENIAIEVLNKEILALKNVEKSLQNKEFQEVVKKVIHCKGRILVSGLGKSGLIGRKIAATFASVGAPSFFIHPTEAVHGDLGSFEKEDILIVLSCSGDTEEVKKVVLFCKEHGIASIAITCNGKSFLAKNCTLSITLDMKEEAINDMPIPTSSCIMMLSVCDAITACVVKNKKFSKEDFYEFHSGGSIGKKIGAIIKRKGKKK